ncbi:hypothetical protein GXB85_04635 [Cellulomonas sp. APG4]|uniref:hypothetical protein n=1 Tax=Cellulomonas sp. APG4 TaxID=1538656 RepID=UPI001379A592|nr:hypothetical protein [Cellulomonas sp. APG4]NCT90240.1 hypothetical protein [Cellulomonas sp. APG4]
MPWLKSGDNAATYPKVMQIAGFRGVDPQTVVNEVFGWLARCMLQCAGHTTDYHLDVGTAYMLGGPRTDALVALCKRAGLLSEVKLDGIKAYKLIEDPEFMHMRLKAEIDAERQRQRDNSNPALTVPVTLRDGDNCRYCGVLTQWRGKTSARTRTLDHREGLGEPATVDTLVVACMRCNSSRQLNPQWDEDHPLRPAPATPLWGVWAADYLTKHGYPTEPNVDLEQQQRPAPAPGADPAPQRVRPATAPGDDPAQRPAKSTSNSLPSPIRTSSLGSGRDGSGLGSDGSGGAGSGARPSRRRGRRGGRSRTTARGDS